MLSERRLLCIKQSLVQLCWKISLKSQIKKKPATGLAEHQHLFMILYTNIYVPVGLNQGNEQEQCTNFFLTEDFY